MADQRQQPVMADAEDATATRRPPTLALPGQSQTTIAPTSTSSAPSLRERRLKSGHGAALRMDVAALNAGLSGTGLTGTAVSSAPAVGNLIASANTTSVSAGAGAADLGAKQAFQAVPYHDEPVEILPRLFLGSERNASHRRVLDRLRIRHIVNVGQECENYFIIGGGGGAGEAGGERTVDLGALAKRRVSASGDLVRGATATATISLDVEEMGGDEEPPLSPIYNPLNMAGAESDPHAASGQWLSSTTAYAAAGADPPQTPLHAEAHSRAPFTPIRTSMPQLPGPKTPVSQPSLAIATRPSRLARSVTAEAAEDTSPAVEAAATGAIPTTVSPDTDVAAMALTLERTRLGTSGEAGGNAVPSHATSSQPFHYLHLPWTHNQENIQSYFPEAFAFMDEGRGNVDDAPVRRSGHTTEDTTLHGVLVHCKQGVSRSASLVIAYVMHARRMSFNDAYALVKSKSPSITPNMSLIYQLLEFEKKVLGRAEEKTGSV